MNLRLILFVVALLVIAWIIWDHKRKTRKQNCYTEKKRDTNNAGIRNDFSKESRPRLSARQSTRKTVNQPRGLAYDIEQEVMTGKNNSKKIDFDSDLTTDFSSVDDLDIFETHEQERQANTKAETKSNSTSTDIDAPDFNKYFKNTNFAGKLTSDDLLDDEDGVVPDDLHSKYNDRQTDTTFNTRTNVDLSDISPDDDFDSDPFREPHQQYFENEFDVIGSVSTTSSAQSVNLSKKSDGNNHSDFEQNYEAEFDLESDAKDIRQNRENIDLTKQQANVHNNYHDDNYYDENEYEDGYEDEYDTESSQSNSSADNANNKEVTNKVFTLYVKAKANTKIRGDELLHGLLSVGCRFGDMNIFHRHEKTSGQGKVLFSVASIVNPGTFDINSMQDKTIPGIALFFTYPGSYAPQTIFDLMLKTAYKLAKYLDAEILDENRELLTPAKTDAIRKKIDLLDVSEYF